ncbi:MAG: hypothetical protein RL497_1483 [Pseudomonadota bacterium]|jgi:hypothetical protein
MHKHLKILLPAIALLASLLPLHTYGCTGDEHKKYIREVRFESDKMACGKELKYLVIKWSNQSHKGAPKPNGIGLVIKNAKGAEVVRYDLPETKSDSFTYTTCINKYYIKHSEIKFYFSEVTRTRTEKNGSVSQSFSLSSKNEWCNLSEIIPTP